jgi:hypothetical protein
MDLLRQTKTPVRRAMFSSAQGLCEIIGDRGKTLPRFRATAPKAKGPTAFLSVGAIMEGFSLFHSFPVSAKVQGYEIAP